MADFDGFSRVMKDRRWEDYTSLKQHLSSSIITEVEISGTVLTGGALAEIACGVGDVINYIAAEGQAYIRTELTDATQVSNYVYLQYQNDTGLVLPWVTADLDGADTVTEVVIGSTDFYRARQMYCELEAVATKGIVLTDANMGGADDVFAFINDTNSQFNLERFFTQPNATCDSYLAHMSATVAQPAVDANIDGFIFAVTFTPRVLNEGEVQATCDKTKTIYFQAELHEEPCILLEGGTEVIFSFGDVGDPADIHFHFVMVEDFSQGKK